MGLPDEQHHQTKHKSLIHRQNKVQHTVYLINPLLLLWLCCCSVISWSDSQHLTNLKRLDVDTNKPHPRNTVARPFQVTTWPHVVCEHLRHSHCLFIKLTKSAVAGSLTMPLPPIGACLVCTCQPFSPTSPVLPVLHTLASSIQRLAPLYIEKKKLIMRDGGQGG